MLMFSMVLATSYAVSVPKNEKKDTGIVIDSKSKTATFKITWNANGGKIGTKKKITTSIEKGSKIKKVPTTPKRSGYTFKGWYTKKSGGKKISKNTKPTKSVIYYAKWKKGSTSSSKIDSKIVGGCSNTYAGSSYAYNFKANGECVLTCIFVGSRGVSGATGKYYTSGGKVYFTNLIEHYSKKPLKNKVSDYSFGTDQYGKYIMLKHFSFNDATPDSESTFKFYKRS